MSQVSLDKVSKSFGSVIAVDRVSVEVNDGEFLVLLGPSGCGKTTTLRLIAGFVLPTSGVIRIGDRNVNSLLPRKRNIGMVFQNYSLFPNMTIGENIAFGLRERKVDKATMARKVTELLNLIRLPGIEDRYSEELSGGQQQRVALARALAYTPNVLLMDEPLGALDRKLREAMQTEIHRIQRELKITTVFVTHDQEEAMSLSDRIAVMADGRIQQIGTPEELYGRPQSAFVADFVGKTNFLDGRVASQADGTCAVAVADGVSVAVTTEGRFSVGDPVTVATRPESLRLSSAAGENGLNSVPGKIERRRFLGNIGHYYVRTPWSKLLLVETAGGVTHYRTGDDVWVVWEPDLSLIYPGEAPQEST